MTHPCEIVTPAFLERLGWQGIVLVLIVFLLLFGGKKLPELARGLARGLKTFRDEMKGIKSEVEEGSGEKQESGKGEAPGEGKKKASGESEETQD